MASPDGPARVRSARVRPVVPVPNGDGRLGARAGGPLDDRRIRRAILPGFWADSSGTDFSHLRWSVEYRFRIGLDSTWRINHADGPDASIHRAVQGNWEDERSSLIEELALDRDCWWSLTLSFEPNGERVTLTYSEDGNVQQAYGTPAGDADTCTGGET